MGYNREDHRPGYSRPLELICYHMPQMTGMDLQDLVFILLDFCLALVIPSFLLEWECLFCAFMFGECVILFVFYIRIPS